MTLSASPAARTHARARWHALADRLRTVSPEAVAKGAIGVALVAVSVQLVVASWPALLPFLVGAVLAYAVLPIANRLDRVMPRWLAALLAELAALAVLVGVVLVVVPPLITSLGILAERLPTPDQVRGWLATVQTQVGSIPEPMRTIALTLMTDVATNLQAVLQGLANQAAALITSQLLGIFGTASNLLGLLVIPAWILTMVSDERAIKQRGARLFAPAIRADVSALFRVVDRAMATFLRIRVLLGLVTGVLVWAGLTAGGALGIGEFRYAAAAGVMLGTLQLIPELGFFLGFFPLLLVLAIGGPLPFAFAVLVYVASAKVASALVETRVSRGVLDVHPGLLIPAIVVLSQFGVIWLLAAAPVVAIVRDLVRYAVARLADPPSPAGVLPGEKVRRPVPAAGSAGNPVPAVYRPAPVVRAVPAAASPARRAAAASASPVPSVYANLPARPGASPSAATQRSAQP